MNGKEIEISRHKGDEIEYCAGCRKTGTNFIDVVAGCLRLPFCSDCFEEFKKMLNGFGKKEIK